MANKNGVPDWVLPLLLGLILATVGFAVSIATRDFGTVVMATGGSLAGGILGGAFLDWATAHRASPPKQ